MLNDLRVRNNENLVRNILKYNNVKDLALTSQVSKAFSKVSDKFQTYWREHMNNTLSAEYEHYNLLSVQNLSDDFHLNDYTNWKQLLKRTFEIKTNWKSLTESSINLYIKDVENIPNEIYSSLKEFIKFPSLRKSNLFIESDINSCLQTYLLDNIFDSQDLYDYFDYYFLQPNEFSLRKNDLPFHYHLSKFQIIIKEFSSLEQTILSKIRWYHYEEVLQIGQNSSVLVNVILLIVKTLHNFCEFSYSYIKKYKYDKILFLNEYSKRYRQYVDVAIHINNYLENLNVLINYIYEHFFNIKYNPKFSFFRLFIKMWNKELLQNLEKEEGFLNKLLSITSNFINKELSELINEENNISDTSFNIANYTNKNLIENCSQHLLDLSCNEFNVFYLNSSELQMDQGLYSKFEKKLLSIYEESCESFLMIPIVKLFKYIQSSEFLNILIPRTRAKITDILISKFALHNRSKIINEFKTYIVRNVKLFSYEIDEHEGNLSDVLEENEEKFIEILMNTNILENKKTTRYKVVKFLNHCKKNNYGFFVDFMAVSDKIKEINSKREETNKLILKENNKRKIYMTLTKTEEKLYSFTKDFRVEELSKPKSTICFTEDFKGYNLDLEIYLKSLMTEECLISYRTK